MTNILKKLPSDQIKINWNKNPIKMADFLGFLTVETVKSTQHLGYYNGWTQYHGENGLVIGGGIVGIEYLDSLQYGQKLSNPYNNYVNPFFLWEILNDEGKVFFLNYYAEEIKGELEKIKASIQHIKANLKNLTAKLKEEKAGLSELGFKI